MGFLLLHQLRNLFISRSMCRRLLRIGRSDRTTSRPRQRGKEKKHFTRAARRLPREKAKKKTLQKKRNSRGHSQKWRKDFVDVTQYGPISTTATAPPSFRVPDIFMGRASYLFDFISFFFPSQHRQIYLFCSLNPSSIISERIFGKVIPHLVEEIVVKYSLRPRCW